MMCSCSWAIFKVCTQYGSDDANMDLAIVLILSLANTLDHIITMLQNLNQYDSVLARSHSNYLAQINIELSQLSNGTNKVVNRLTFFATMAIPLNLVAGLFGMNVKVRYKALLPSHYTVC